MKNMHLILIAMFALIILLSFVFFYYIWNNRESANSMDLFVKIAIAFFAALLIILLEVVKPAQNDTKEIKIPVLRVKNMLITDEFSNMLWKASSSNNGYNLLNNVYLFSLKKQERYDYDKLSIDLLEYTIWVWLSKKYHIHWQMTHNYFEGFAGGGYSGSAIDNAEKDTYKLSIEQLSKELQDSYFKVSENNFWGVAFPANSKLVYTVNENSRRIFTIENRYILLTFSIIYIGNSGVEHSNLGNKILRSLRGRYGEEFDCFTNNFILTINCEYKKFYKGSPETKAQKKWVNDLMEQLFLDFDFSILYKNLEKAYVNY